MRVVSCREMRQIEEKAIASGLSVPRIIENVGIRCADSIYNGLNDIQKRRELLVLVGKGNNGADALAIARHLRCLGPVVRAFLLYSKDEGKGEFQEQLKLAEAYGVKITEIKSIDQVQSYFTQTLIRPVVLDGIFGIGARFPLANNILEVIRVVNRYSDYIISIDIPTGLCADSGQIHGQAIKASKTFAIGVPKLGHYLSKGPEFVGQLSIICGGFSPELTQSGDVLLLEERHLALGIHQRNKFAHKNAFGHTLIIGGSLGMTGALVLAARAALASGSGLVTAACPQDAYLELAGRLPPEIMIGTFPEKKEEGTQLLEDLPRYDCIVIGPGLGKGDYVRDLVLLVLRHFSGPVVLDADGLNALTLLDKEIWPRMREAPILLTPHIGEFSRLISEKKDKILSSSLKYLKKCVGITNCSILLKGACSLVAHPEGKTYFSYYPNDGMATGGSGDVLAGIMGGILSQAARQNSEIYWEDEINLGVLVHACAGKIAASEHGGRAMTASSIIDNMGKVFLKWNEEHGDKY